MTIQRQYVLPNCSLVLEGLSADASNVLSILASAEFKIVGIEQPLTGGVDFFKSVVGAVSAYHQRLLSGLDHPEHMPNQASPVGVEPGEGQYHRLTIKPELLSESGETPISQPIDLSTVQLFDMAEAIDQFCADNQTLPDFSISLAPLARKYVRPEEPLAQRAIPPLLGFGTLAVAALGLFFLPVPELADPENREQQNTAALANSNDDESVAGTPVADIPATDAQPATADDVANTETAAPDQTSGPITDSTQLTELQQQVQQQISAALPSDSAFDQSLRYQVSVAENGDILGYNPLDEVSLDNLDSTPLPTLTYIPVDATSVEPVAQFEVTLAADGTVDVISETVTPETITPEVVSPESVDEEDSTSEDSTSRDTTAPSSSSQSADDDSSKSIASTTAPAKLSSSIGRPIQDSDRIYELNQALRRSIIDNRVDDWSGPEVRYRVRVDEDGNVIGYEADNSAAEQYAADFKIPDLVQTATTEQPQLDFLVVIGDNNVVEVNPWDGWP